MPERRHDQYCSMARALDVVGDRWSLLVVRELGFGPRRFTDLLDGLPGVSRNLLTQRLRDLERDGIVRRRELPPPAARQVYELTEDGTELSQAMLPLAAWGVRRLGRRRPEEHYRPHWAAVAMAGFANRDAARGVHDTYEFRIGEETFHLRVDDGEIALRQGPADRPDVVVRCDEDTWADVASGATSTAAAAGAGRLQAEGAPEAALRLAAIFSREAMLDEEGRPRSAGAPKP